MYCLFKFSRIYIFFFVEKIIYIFFRYDISGNKFGVYQEELYDGFKKLGLLEVGRYIFVSAIN